MASSRKFLPSCWTRCTLLGSAKMPRARSRNDGVVFPAAFPELVDHLHIFVRDVVAVVVARSACPCPAPRRGAVEIAGDDVPADPPLGQMIERRHAPGKRIGRLVGEVAGDAEAEMLGHGRHRRDQQQRIVDRGLRGIAQRRVGTAAEDVIDAEHVGKEQAVEPAALQRLREVDPVGQAVVVGGAVARMRPQSRRLMRDAIHRKGVEPDFFLHVN